MSRVPLIRRIILVLLIAAIMVGAGVLLGTESGRDLLRDPLQYKQTVRDWVAARPWGSPIAYILIVLLAGVLALPVWWMQILAGFAFGLKMGIVWAQIAIPLTALCTASLSRFLLSEWFHTRIETHMARVKSLNEKLGHNGLLVVCAVRAMHFIPTGPSNYALGLTTISLLNIVIGTFLGGISKAVIYATLGADPSLLTQWRYIIIIASLYVILIVPLVLRYTRPEWFRRAGIE